MTMQLLDQLILLSDAGWDIQLIVVDNGSNDFHRLTQWFRINNGRFAEALIVGSSSNLGVAGGRAAPTAARVGLELRQAPDGCARRSRSPWAEV